MTIDARSMAPRALYIRLKELFVEQCACDVSADIVLATRAEAKKAEAFVKMSGYTTSIEEGKGSYILRISGSSCKCSL